MTVCSGRTRPPLQSGLSHNSIRQPDWNQRLGRQRVRLSAVQSRSPLQGSRRRFVGLGYRVASTLTTLLLGRFLAEYGPCSSTTFLNAFFPLLSTEICRQLQVSKYRYYYYRFERLTYRAGSRSFPLRPRPSYRCPRDQDTVDNSIPPAAYPQASLPFSRRDQDPVDWSWSINGLRDR